ncbi:MAG: T9SS type A sorting domain-containing protein [Gilvibacter sp.]
MRKLILLGLGLAAVFTIYLTTADSTTSDSTQRDTKTYPNEYMYNQRAYPNNVFNKKNMRRAKQQAQQRLSEKSGGSDEWVLEGPLNTGGRITDVAISPDSDNVMFVTTAVGGVFKTTDGGTNWTPIFDQIGQPSIGNITIAPSDANRIYVGTGEANGSATSGAFFGDGIYRSDDGGTTWENKGLAGSDHIGRIVVDPADSDRVFAAATGTLYGYNSERGIYRTLNGGDDWERVLFVTDSTAAIDVVMNPVNTDILFAAMWERTRKPWQRDYGGVTSAIHRSTDGGTTWDLLGGGLPAPATDTGRIGLAISESDPSIIYASYTANEITNTFDGLYKSEDNGDTWALVALADIADVNSSFGWYFGNVRVHPTDPDEVYVLGQRLYRTSNGGTSWTSVTGMHVDHHAIEYSNTNPNFILAGNDGGAYTSSNGGLTWNKFENLPITQFYNIEVDFSQPERLYGGTQDNNTIRTTTGGLSDYTPIWGGDGFHVNVDPNDNNFIYVESQFGNLGRSINGGASFSNATTGINPSDRRNWNTPVILSPFDSNKVLCGTNRLYISDNSAVWSAISPDLTDGEHPSGAFSYGTITAIAASYNNLNVFYTGSDDGNVYVTFDGGSNWENISAGLPDRYVTSLAISPDSDNIIYVTFSGFGLLDYDPHVFKSIDGGINWIDISGNLPGIPVNDIVRDNTENVLFVATDLGVWYSENEGDSWDMLGDNLPLTIVRDLKIHKPTNTLFAGTFGRSIHSYDMDQLVLSIPENSLAENIVLYPNPATATFWLRLPKGEEAKNITILDLQGRLVQQVKPNQIQQEAEALKISLTSMPHGVYLVKLEIDGQLVTKRLLVGRE